MGDKSVEDLLDAWGLSQYKEKFKGTITCNTFVYSSRKYYLLLYTAYCPTMFLFSDEGVTFAALQVLTTDHLFLLVPTVGDNALLQAYIKALKDITTAEISIVSNLFFYCARG